MHFQTCNLFVSLWMLMPFLKTAAVTPSESSLKTKYQVWRLLRNRLNHKRTVWGCGGYSRIPRAGRLAVIWANVLNIWANYTATFTFEAVSKLPQLMFVCNKDASPNIPLGNKKDDYHNCSDITLLANGVKHFCFWVSSIQYLIWFGQR